MMHIRLFDRPEQDRPITALGLLLAGVLVLALQDTMVKLFSDATSFWQFQVIRSIFNTLFVVMLAYASNGIGILWPKKPFYVFLRAFFLSICMLFFFGAVTEISVAQMAAGLYTYPLFVTLLASPILGEKIGIWRVTALLIGAAGSFIVLNPLADDFKWLQLMPVIAGFFYACNILTLRRYCRNESPLALALGVSTTFIIFGVAGSIVMALIPIAAETRAIAPFVLVSWPELTAFVLGFCIIASVINLMGNIFLSRAYQTADSSLLAPMDFSYLVFMALWGKLLFDAWPTTNAALGMILIAAAGVITAIRENRHRLRPIKPGRGI